MHPQEMLQLVQVSCTTKPSGAASQVPASSHRRTCRSLAAGPCWAAAGPCWCCGHLQPLQLIVAGRNAERCRKVQERHWISARSTLWPLSVDQGNGSQLPSLIAIDS